MRIVFYTDSITIGGAEYYLKILASGLKDKGHEVIVAKDFDEVLRNKDADIIHFNMPDAFSCGREIEAASRIPGKKLFATIHSLSKTPTFKAGQRFKEWVALNILFWDKFDKIRGAVSLALNRSKVRAKLMKLHKIIAVSKASKADFTKTFGLPENNIAVVYNGIPEKKYPDRVEARMALGLPLNLPVIACVGRLVKNKGQDVFLKAAAQVKRDIPNAKFLIVGDGYLKERLIKLTKRLGLTPYVSFLDYQKADLVYGAMDISVVPSLEENFPYVVIESIMAGKPVVASGVGGIPELIENNLVKPGNDAGIAKAVVGILKDGNRTRIGSMSGRFTIAEMIKGTEKVYAA